MAAVSPAAPSSAGPGWLAPWRILLVGLGLTVVGLALAWAGNPWPPSRAVLLFAGLVVSGAAVARRFQTAGWAFDQRLESAGLLAAAAFGGVLAYIGFDPAWDSMRMALSVLIGVALAGAGLVLMSATARKVVASLLVLFHFGGILTAVTSIAPPSGDPPWLASQLWTRVYRPYLNFMYLNNAYHFYSPEPGPPAMLWFHLTYKDGTMEWVKVPDRDKSVFPLHHTRLLSITEMASDSSPVPRVNNPQATPEMQWDVVLQTADGKEVEKGLVPRRREGLTDGGQKIPLDDPSLPLPFVGSQYSEPKTYFREMTRSAAHHVAESHPWRGDPSNPLLYVKVYRLRHGIIYPRDMAYDVDPWAPTWYVIFFQGKFDPEGNLLSVTRDDQGNVVEQDPFLYWQIPVFRKPKDRKAAVWPGMAEKDTDLYDYLTVHAGSSPWGDAAAETEKGR
jgi:hypothetical protein